VRHVVTPRSVGCVPRRVGRDHHGVDTAIDETARERETRRTRTDDRNVVHRSVVAGGVDAGYISTV